MKQVIHRWGGTTAAFFSYTHFSHDLVPGILAALLPLMRDSLGLTYMQAGFLLSAFAITSGLSQFLGGWLGDRFDRNAVAAMGMAGVGLFAVMVGFTSAYSPLLIVLIMMGVFSGAFHPAVLSIMATWFEVKQRGKAAALYMVGGSIGFALGPVLGGLIAIALGWHYSFVILGVPAIIAAPLMLTRFRQRAVEDTNLAVSTNGLPPPSPAVKRVDLGGILRTIAPVLAMAILMQLFVGSAMAFLTMYLVDRHHVAPALAAISLGIVRSGGIMGVLFGGWLSDRWGRRNAVVLALACTGPLLYLMTVIPLSPVLIVFIVIFGVFNNMRQSTVQPMLMDSVPAHLRATVFGIYFGLGMEGASMVQPVAGHFMDVFDINTVFTTIALMSVAVSILAVLLQDKIGRTVPGVDVHG